MDVLVGFMPAPVRTLLRIAEQLLLAVLAGFVLTQSYFYARQMLRIERSSDMAGVPMWIPHGVIALGFGLILIIALSRVLGAARRPPEPAAKGEAKP
jgi:TRAP-type C4-dicarboxylate transport system permease small subunit